VVIGERDELLGRGVTALGVSWLDEPARVGEAVEVQVRYRAPATPAEVVRVEAGEIELALQQPVAAITPGQSLVMFRGEKLIGGGFIEAALPARQPLPVMRR